MLPRFLKFAIRKDYTRKNTKINHRQYTQSMFLSQKVPYLLKYHKKKVIASIVAALIAHTYDWHKSIYRKVMQMRSPMNWVYSWVSQDRHIPQTILEQSYVGSGLNQKTINVLTQLYYDLDRQLYFGVGRYYLFNVFKDMGLIQTGENQLKFWRASGFFKERNQKASGVGLTQFLNIFQQGYKYLLKKDPEIDEKTFLLKFMQELLSKKQQTKQWQHQFNIERKQQFIKNLPGDNMKKQQAILDLIRQSTNSQANNYQPMTYNQLQQSIIKMGMRGLSYADKFLYWQLIRTWKILKAYNINKKISHPLCTEIQKLNYDKQLQKLVIDIQQIESTINQTENKFKAAYNQDIL